MTFLNPQKYGCRDDWYAEPVVDPRGGSLNVYSPIGLTTLLLGATGATGKHLLKEVLSSEHFSKVSEWGRSVTAPAKLPEAGKQKLEQKTIDFDNLDVPTFKQGNWDVIFITYGLCACA